MLHLSYVSFSKRIKYTFRSIQNQHTHKNYVNCQCKYKSFGDKQIQNTKFYYVTASSENITYCQPKYSQTSHWIKEKVETFPI